MAMLALSLSITYSRALSHNTGETRPRAGIEAITSVEPLRVALSLSLSLSLSPLPDRSFDEFLED